MKQLTDSSKRGLAASFVFCLLYGCGSTPVVPVAPDPVVETKQTVDVDPSLLVDCPTLDTLNVQSYNKQQTLDAISVIVGKYSTCWHNHHSLAEVTTKAFNINSVPDSK